MNTSASSKKTTISIISSGASTHSINIPNGSQEHLVPVRSRSTLFKKKREYSQRTVFCLIGLIVLLILSVIFLTISYFTGKSVSKSICESFECIRSAANLATSMDKTANPCEDFYQFTCGHWDDEHPRPDSRTNYDWFTERQERVTRQVRAFLQQNTSYDDPIPVKQIRKVYKACMDTETLNDIKFQPIFEFLESVGLPRVPHYFNLTNPAPSDFKFDWLTTVVKIKRKIRKDVIIGFGILPDYRNRSINRLCLGSPARGDPFPSLIGKKAEEHLSEVLSKTQAGDNHYDEDGEYVGHDLGLDMEEEDDDDDNDGDLNATERLAYQLYINAIMRTIILNSNITEFPTRLDADVTQAVLIYWNTSKFISKLGMNTTVNTTVDDFQDLTIDEIQTYTDNYLTSVDLPVLEVWKPYIELLFNDTGVELDLNDTDKILLDNFDLEYMAKISEFITNTPDLIIELYVWWAAIENMVVHTTSDVRELKYRLYSLLTSVEGSKVRSIHCTNVADTMMGMATSYGLASPSFLEDTKPKVVQMFKDIRSAFKRLIKKLDWMDRETKAATLEKCDSMHGLIGFPEWLLNRTSLEKFYSGITVNEKEHLNNMINILEVSFTYTLKRLHSQNYISWATTPTDVNAFHAFQMNTITLNYGAIGAILGHELTHGFDDIGRQFDKVGNLVNWWTDETTEEYVNRTECFRKQYDAYIVPEIRKHIDGQKTLGENLADNGGLTETIEAYKLYESRNGKEPLLPGFEQFSHMQLLFIAFGNLWCESVTASYLKWAIKEDSHCPGRIRLHGAVVNTPEFAKAFKCPKGSPMNPIRKRCQLW